MVRFDDSSVIVELICIFKINFPKKFDRLLYWFKKKIILSIKFEKSISYLKFSANISLALHIKRSRQSNRFQKEIWVYRPRTQYSSIENSFFNENLMFRNNMLGNLQVHVLIPHFLLIYLNHFDWVYYYLPI